MSVYFISACHKCKEHVMWSKCKRVTAEKWHKDYEEQHKEHKNQVQMSTDNDDEFYDRIYHYKDLGIKDGVTV